MVSNLKKYRHIVWDWNGTLIDDVEACVGVVNTLLVRYGIAETTLEQYLREFDFPVIDYYRKLGFDFDKVSFDRIAEEYIAIYRKKQFECSLQENAEDVVKLCADGGVGQSILSAYNQKTLEEVIEFFGLKHFFTRIVGLNDLYAACKIENGRNLLKKLALAGSDVLLIGDTVHDFKVAQQIGADCILIDDGHQSREKLESTGAVVLASIKEVPGVFFDR